MKFEVKEKVYEGELEIGDEKYKFKAYSPGLEVSLFFIEAQENEDTKTLLKAIDRYYEESVEFDGFGSAKTKQKVRKMLERSGKFVEFVNAVLAEVGKSE